MKINKNSLSHLFTKLIKVKCNIKKTKKHFQFHSSLLTIKVYVSSGGFIH